MKTLLGIVLVAYGAFALADDPPAVAASAEAPSAKGATFSGGDGTSPEKAVIVTAPNSHVGVPAEYEWIGRHYPGAQVSQSSLIVGDGKYYDSVTFKTKEGTEVTLYFDITGFVNNNLK